MNNQAYYLSTSDNMIKACLNKEIGQWHFTVDALKIPIFMSYCPQQGYIDLGDGSDEALLAKEVNEVTYTKVVADLEKFWIPGSYYIGEYFDLKYVFKTGTMAHEQHHYAQILEQLSKEFNKSFEKISELSQSATISPCPENAIDQLLPQINSTLGDAITEATKDKGQGKSKAEQERIKLTSEQPADDAARPIYRKILERINAWAKNQRWWNKK
ncbi:MAG: hypothetical protein HY276_00935 [Ignavibacteriales bacterium]|nr:hypothetical protein [Ignavibacteriales bacterium]